MRLTRLFVLTATALFSTACVESMSPANSRLGIITVRAFSAGADTVVRGSGVFYRLSDVTINPIAPSSCTQSVYDPDALALTPPTIDAGPQLAFTVAGLELESGKIQLGSFTHYEMTSGQALTFSAGDSVTVSVPGATGGFEPTTLKTRLAEAFTVSPIPEFVSGDSLLITWTAAPAPGAFMIVSLLMASNASSTEPDIEIRCVYADDGDGAIPAGLAQFWGQANELSRSSKLTRVREATFSADARTRARLRSVYEVPTNPLPVPTLRAAKQ